MKFSFAIVFLLITCITQCQSNKYTILIPKGYQGLFFIFFNQNKGESTSGTYKNVFRIPGDGILLTKASIIPDFSFLEFYYLDSLGNQIQILKQCPDSTLTYCTSSVKVNGGSYLYYSSKNDKNPINYIKMSVSDNTTNKKIRSKQYYSEFEKKLTRKLNRPFSFPRQ